MNTSSEFNLSLFWRAVKRHKVIFVVIFFITLGLSLWLSHEKPRKTTSRGPSAYRSSMVLLVSPPANSKKQEDTSSSKWFANEKLFKQLLLDEELLRRVANTVQLAEWSKLKKQISLSPVDQGEEWAKLRGSYLIQLDVEADSPEESQDLANNLIQELVVLTQELSASEAIASRRLLEEMLVDNKKLTEIAQQDIVKWRMKHDVWDVNELIDAHGEKIARLQAKREGLLSALDGVSKKNAAVVAYRNGQSNYLPPDIESTTAGLREAELRLEAEQTRLDQLRQVYLDSNESVQAQKLVMEPLRKEVSRQRNLAANSAQTLISQETTKQRLALRRLDAEIQALKGNENLANSQIELESLQSQLASLKDSTEDLEGQLSRARVLEEKLRHKSFFTVLEQPEVGKAVSRRAGPTGRAPRSLKDRLLLSFGFSFVLALGIVVLYDYYLENSRFRPVVEEALSLPVLGLIPRVDKQLSGRWSEGKTEGDEHFLVASAPSSVVAEQFRTLVVNLMNQGETPRRILVTSCWPGEGKSLVSANLAAGLSRFKYKVALVDGDLRKPHLSKAFKQEDSIGLRECLERGIPADEAFQSTELEGVSFLPSGIGETNAAELLANKEELEKLFDSYEDRLLLIDTPPLSVCSDALQFGSLVDGVIVVVNQKKWDGKLEKEYLEDLHDHEIPILGIVLNSVKTQEVGYGYKGYYQYHGYGQGKK